MPDYSKIENYVLQSQKQDRDDLVDTLRYTTQYGLLPEKKPKTEEEELAEFIRDYINPQPDPVDLATEKAMRFLQMYGGSFSKLARQSGKSIHTNLLYQALQGNINGRRTTATILDECSFIKDPCLKPTKKQRKLLKKFRKLKRFK